MVHFCCVFGCKEKTTKDYKVSFHSFPKDEERRRLWLSQIRRESFSISDSTKICSKHFTPDSFDKEKFGGTWLKKTAVPTLSVFPDYSLPGYQARNPPKEKNTLYVIKLLPESRPLSKEVQKRWKNMKNSYAKAIKNEGGKCDPRKTKRPHIHQRQMKFLKEVYRESNSKTASGEVKDSIPFEPSVQIKEEPMDYHPTPSTSTDTTNKDFILSHKENSRSTPNPVVEPQFTLSVANLASFNAPETSNDGQKRKINPSTMTTYEPSDVSSQSLIPSLGEFSNSDSSKEPRKDQLDAFGEYIVAKLRTLDWRSSAFAQKAIVDIIYEAEMGKFLKLDCEYIKS